MEQAQTLIDKAAEVCGSRYKLAKLTGVSQGNLSEMVQGERGLPPALAGELAAMVGEDPRNAALVEVIAKEKDAERRERLATLFGLDSDEWRKRWDSNPRTVARRWFSRPVP